MRNNFTILLAGIGLLLSACTPITKELRYPGGYPGYQLDKRTFDASRSKQLQLLRGAIVLGMAARIGEANVSTEEAEPFAQHLAAAAQEVNFAAGDLPFEDNPVCEIKAVQTAPQALAADQACNGYVTNFEADVSRVEARVVRVMIAALPTERVKNFLEDLTNGNLLGAALSAAEAFGDAAGSFHRAAGVYRSGLEVAALQRPDCQHTDRSIGVVAALGCLGIPPEELFHDATKNGDPYTGDVSPAAFHAIMRIVRTSCVGLPLSNELDGAALLEVREARRKACAKITFAPVKRPEQVPPEEEQNAIAVPPGDAGIPEDASD